MASVVHVDVSVQESAEINDKPRVDYLQTKEWPSLIALLLIYSSVLHAVTLHPFFVCAYWSRTNYGVGSACLWGAAPRLWPESPSMALRSRTEHEPHSLPWVSTGSCSRGQRGHILFIILSNYSSGGSTATGNGRCVSDQTVIYNGVW